MTTQQRHMLFIGIALALVAVAVYFTYPVKKSMKLGLDLQGGVSILLEAKDTPKAKVTTDAMDNAEKIIRDRVDALGVAEPGILRQGTRYILVQLPGVKDQKKAIDIIGKTALLEFREVLDTAAVSEDKLGPVTKDPQPDKEVVLLDRDGQSKYKLGPTLMTGKGIQNAQVEFDEFGASKVGITFNAEGSKQFDQIGEKLYQKRVAIILDDRVQSSPNVNARKFGGRAEISGKFTTEDAKTLALVLQTGALPVKLDMVEVRTVGATLGLDALRAGLLAGIIGLILVAVYMLIYYRGLGMITVLALAVFGSILLGIVAVLGLYGNKIGIYYAMTLPGIAGIILSIGVAADSSIIIFERFKEEVNEGKTVRVAASSGFKNGFKTMVDADLVTFITAFIIYIVAVGPVRGFAFTLMLGIFIDLFTAFFFTQSALFFVANTDWLKKPVLLGVKEVGQ